MQKKYLFSRICAGLSSLSFVLLALSALQAQPINMDEWKALKPRSIGPAGMSGRVTSIAVVHDDPRTMYLGTASGGLWKSESGGTAWSPIFDEEAVASIGAVAVCQQNPDILWAGTGEGNPRNSQTNGYGVYKSLDGGHSWKLMGLEHTRNIHRLIIHPENPDIVYVGAQGAAWGEHPERGVYKTTDGGETWEHILSVNEKTGIADLVMDPANPNKLIAAMWEFRRWPWFFKSGGAGSGLYITFDGGKTWQQRTEKDGLPAGELGRMGLAIAPGNPKRVYAYVESSENALYRSDDGGFKWQKMSTNAGNRPFYYADIYADPLNENRLYSIHTTITRSEDGGKTFEEIAPYLGYSGLHPDHHAFWIHPDDPDFMIEGNDGGVSISHDRGVSWRFSENLPLAQFYHIRVDNEQPYHIYGGMQDNGSWRGPGYLYRYGGIRNAYWDEVSFGDGFDVVPDPEDATQGYSMSQGGSLVRYDIGTGATRYIAPVHPDGNILRFNWNAGIAQDPFDAATIYYGSQFVHKSTDRGESWEIISPDLTTNDPEKQKQLESGGLTYDVTDAENYTTILTIAPSTLQQGLIWAGTDDGNVQVTRDGGKTWENVLKNIKGLPAGTWIPQIQPSRFEAGAAFVVANDYRRHNYAPYLFYTRDYGKTWQRLAAEKDVWGYCLSFIQDPIEPRLMFLGTEYGLYVSIDAGENWTKWKHGCPTVSTMDMAIQEREHDLVIGTFGRAAFVLDDIRPLRALAAEGKAVQTSELYAFEPPVAVIAEYGTAPGTRFLADAMYAGENRPFGAMISYWVKTGAAKKAPAKEEKEAAEEEKPVKADSVRITVLDQAGKSIRSLQHLPDTGLNRIQWDLRMAGGLSMSGNGRSSGPRVVPGTYRLCFAYGTATDTVEIEVRSDPRLDLKTEDLEAQLAFNQRVMELYGQAALALKQLREAKSAIELVLKQLPEGEDSTLKAVRTSSTALKDSIQQLIWRITERDDKQGYFSDPSAISSRIGSASYRSYNARSVPNATQERLLNQVTTETQVVMSRINRFFEEDWRAYQKQVDAVDLSPFKAVKAIGEE